MADKRLRIMLISFMQKKAYPLDFILNILTFPIFVLITYFAWDVILKNSTIASVGLAFLVTYYTTIYAVRNITSQGAVAEKISEGVRRGSMVVNLVRPMSYTSYLFWWRLPNFIMYLCIYMAILALLSIAFHMNYSSDPLMIVLFVISLFFGYLMKFAMFLMVGITAFWLEDNWGFIRAFSVIQSFLAGVWIPLELLPEQLKEIVFMLPFRLTAHFQVSIVQGKLSLTQILPDFILMVVWTIIFFALAITFWKIGERKYTGYGV